jgi:hypothetical protein
MKTQPSERRMRRISTPMEMRYSTIISMILYHSFTLMKKEKRKNLILLQRILKRLEVEILEGRLY